GRPDMAIFKFTRSLIAGETIEIYNHGQMKRDFTYIDDVVEGICRLIEKIPAADPNWNEMDPDPASSFAPYRIFNIGNRQPVELMQMVKLLEQTLDVEAILRFLPLQAGDVLETFADVAD